MLETVPGRSFFVRFTHAGHWQELAQHASRMTDAGHVWYCLDG